MGIRFKKLGLVILILNIVEQLKRKIDSIVIHTSYSPQGRGDDAKTNNKWHKERFGSASGCGYHFIILEDGTIQQGRSVEYMGAHAKGYNSDSIGICWIGGDKGKNDITSKQYTSLVSLTNHLAKIYKIKNSKILGHNEFPNVKKTCPIISMDKFRRDVLGNVTVETKIPSKKKSFIKSNFYEVLIKLFAGGSFIPIKKYVREQIEEAITNKEKRDIVIMQVKAHLGIKNDWIIDILIKIALYYIRAK